MIERSKDDREPRFESIDDLAERAQALLSRLEEKEQELARHLEAIRERSEAAASRVAEIERIEQSARALEDAVGTLQSSLEQDRSAIADLSGQAERLLAEVGEREQELADRAERNASLQARIEELLPGATSAGLASAFRERRRALRRPRRTWGIVFVLAVLALLVVAYLDPLTFEPGLPDYPNLLPWFAERLPLIVPIVVLAVYAGIRHRQALRLEEEYAHKETLAQSFEGFKRQLLEVDGDSPEKRQTLDFIQRTLEALSLHPGRVYLGRRAQRGGPDANRDGAPDEPPPQ